jgi:hypothetical protein
MGYGLDGQVRFPVGARVSPALKRPGREADHSPPSSAEVKKIVELYFHFSICLHGMVLN